MELYRKSISRRVLATLLYFDLFDYPLSAYEVWKWLLSSGREQSSTSLGEVEVTLERLRADSRVGSACGFFFLPGRETLTRNRLRNQAKVEWKFRRLRHIVRILRVFPFVRALAATGSLAQGAPPRSSDLDLFLLASVGRLWTARLFVVAFLKFFGLRPQRERKRDTICLNFLATEGQDISRLRLLPRDLHFTQWVAQFVPFFTVREHYTSFAHTNAWWIQALFPHAPAVTPVPRRVLVDSPWTRTIRATFEFPFRGRLGDLFERWARSFQMRILPTSLKARVTEGGTAVVLSDTILKFHDHDRRPALERAFDERARALGL